MTVDHAYRTPESSRLWHRAYQRALVKLARRHEGEFRALFDLEKERVGVRRLVARSATTP